MKNIIKYSILYLIFAISTITACPHDKDSIITITTQDQLKSLLANSLGPSAISFHMDRCSWCNKMHPIYEEVANNKQFGHVTFYKVNGPTLKAETHVKKALHKQIPGYPYMILMNQGKVVKEQIGGTSSRVIIQQLNSLSK